MPRKKIFGIGDKVYCAECFDYTLSPGVIECVVEEHLWTTASGDCRLSRYILQRKDGMINAQAQFVFSTYKAARLYALQWCVDRLKLAMRDTREQLKQYRDQLERYKRMIAEFKRVKQEEAGEEKTGA